MTYAGAPPLLEVQVVRPGGLFSSPQVVATTPLQVPELRSSPRGALRLYAGQVDPHDASHFTIEYRAAHGGGMIDGWLQNDDTVKFRVRSKP